MSNDNEREIEQAIVEAGKTAARITPADVDAAIQAEQYHVFDGTTLTVCVLTLQNGFTVTGESAAASPENFDRAIGERIARDNARNKIWPLLGYALRDRLHQETGGTWLDRVKREYDDLAVKVEKLSQLLAKPQPAFVPNEQWHAMGHQLDYMTNYLAVLHERLALAA